MLFYSQNSAETSCSTEQIMYPSGIHGKEKLTNSKNLCTVVFVNRVASAVVTIKKFSLQISFLINILLFKKLESLKLKKNLYQSL